MPTDRYTRAVLTVIAASLAALVVQNATPKATAQLSGLTCTPSAPCYVTNIGLTPLNIIDAHATPPSGSGQVRGLPRASGQYK